MPVVDIEKAVVDKLPQPLPDARESKPERASQFIHFDIGFPDIVGDRVEQAYRRGDALDRRRRLMEDWAGFLG